MTTYRDRLTEAMTWAAIQHNCESPRRCPPGEPVYDSTFWHVIVPELIRRLER